MIKVFPFEELGGAKLGWLETKYHFSFADYYNPERTRFGLLRVINDDIIEPHTGFDTHRHQDMEIITYVRSGAITHKDSEGNEGRTEAGDVQVMSAGSGIAHSEHNREDTQTSLYQIWIFPNEKNVKPRWEARRFPKEPVDKELVALVSGRAEDLEKGALKIHQDARILGGRLSAGTEIHQSIRHQAYLLVSKGELEIEGKQLKQGDGAEITERKSLHMKALSDAEVLVIDVPKN